MSTTSPLDLLAAAATDGRTTNIRYRQDQLHALHAALTTRADDLCTALASSSSSSADAETEFYLTMACIRRAYDSLDFAGGLAAEYAVARGEDNPSRRVGVGRVIIRPGRHSRLFSVVSPLAAAVAAGNCLVVELVDDAHAVEMDGLLRTVLSDALDPNTFYASPVRLEEDHDPKTVLVDQTAAGVYAASLTTQLLSSNGARVVAIVDRSADLEAAARAVTAARFKVGGGASPYAPDLVVVNEFVGKAFLEACERCVDELVKAGGEGGKGKRMSDEGAETREAVRKAEASAQVRTLGKGGVTLVDVRDRSSPLLTTKITGLYLPITTCTSLTDALFNFTEDSSSPSSFPTLLAAYLFAEPRAAKYLAQHLDAHVACINHIPAHLLFGPAAPIAHAPDYAHRYTPDMFELARPQFQVHHRAQPPSAKGSTGSVPLPLLLQPAGHHQGSKTKKSETAALRAQAVRPLRPTGQPSNFMLGFFEHGILIGLGITLSFVLPLVGYASYFLGRKGWAVVMRRA